MGFGLTIIQPQAKLNFKNTIEGVDTAESDGRNADIAAMNRICRIEWREWQEAHQ